MQKTAVHHLNVMEFTTGENEMSLRREIVRYTRELGRRNFAPGTAGNVSARLNRTRILITPTGRSKSSISQADLITVDLDGNVLSGGTAPSSEMAMHLEIYRHRPDVRAVVHGHPPIATAFACSGMALDRVLCQEAAMTLGPVPLAEYATTGTEHVGRYLIPHLADHDAVLLANHGVVSYASSVQKAFHNLEVLEHLAQVHLIAYQLGTPKYLDSDQLLELTNARQRYLDGLSPSGSACPEPHTGKEELS